MYIYVYSTDFFSCMTHVLFLNTDHIFEKEVSLIVFRQKFYQHLLCRAHFQFSNPDLFEKVVWKLLFENCFSFSSLTLHIVNFLLWKKINTVNRSTTFRTFLMERSGCPTKRGNRVGGFPCKPKSSNFPLLLDKNITYWEIPHIGEKSLLAFRQVSTKVLPAACIQLHNYELVEKARLIRSPLLQNCVKQDYLPESRARYLPS